MLKSDFKNKAEYSQRLMAIMSLLKELGTEEFPNWSNDLMIQRAYVKPEQRDYFVNRVGVFKAPSNVNFMSFYNANKDTYKAIWQDMMLFKVMTLSDTGVPYLVLHDRYIVPIRNAQGDWVSATGWMKTDYSSKYMNVPTPFLDKTVDWFGMDLAIENYSKGRHYVCVVEGIFDCLSMNALGLPCVAVMGADFKRSKGMMLQAFGRVISVPDNDRVGKQRGLRWQYPNTVKVTVVDLRGQLVFEELDQPLRVKDTDNLCSYMDSDWLRELFDEIALNDWRKQYTLVVE